MDKLESIIDEKITVYVDDSTSVLSGIAYVLFNDDKIEEKQEYRDKIIDNGGLEVYRIGGPGEPINTTKEAEKEYKYTGHYEITKHKDDLELYFTFNKEEKKIEEIREKGFNSSLYNNETLSFLTFNCAPRIEHGNSESEFRILESAMRLNYDFIGTQESCGRSIAKFGEKHHWNSYKEQYQYITKLNRKEEFEWGNYLFYNSDRWEKIESNVINVTIITPRTGKDDKIDPRDTVWGFFKDKIINNREILVINSHLHHPTDKYKNHLEYINNLENDLNQDEKLKEKLDSDNLVMIVLMGDFNEAGGLDTENKKNISLHNKYTLTQDREFKKHTHKNQNFGQLDKFYIWANENIRKYIKEGYVDVYDEYYISGSDHKPIECMVSF